MATKYADIHIKVSAKLKEDTEATLSAWGLSLTDFIRMAMTRTVVEQKPFVEDLSKSEFAQINTREELKDYLQHLFDDDDGVRYTEKELQAKFSRHRKEIKRMERKRNARIQDKIYA